MAHFKRMQERPSVKKLLAYEKEVNEGFAKTGLGAVDRAQTLVEIFFDGSGA